MPAASNAVTATVTTVRWAEQEWEGDSDDDGVGPEASADTVSEQDEQHGQQEKQRRRQQQQRPASDNAKGTAMLERDQAVSRPSLSGPTDAVAAPAAASKTVGDSSKGAPACRRSTPLRHAST